MKSLKWVLCGAAVCALSIVDVGVRAQAVATQAVNVATGAAGTWQGTLSPGGDKNLRIIVKIAQADGKWSAAMYSIDQNPQPMKANAVTVSGDSVKIDMSMIGGAFEGKLTPDSKTINGTWAQGPGSMPLKLDRQTKETAWEIPPPPPPPKLMPANADPAFEVATIKPHEAPATQMQGLHIDGSNRFTTEASSLSDLISFAYDVQLKQVVGNEVWMSEDRFDVMAKADVEGVPSPAQLKVMIKKLLAERFALKMHEEKREMSAFVLTVAKGGIKFQENTSKDPLPGLGFPMKKDGLGFVMHNATMGDFANIMQTLALDRPVVNETGLTARYDMNFTFTPDASMFNGHPPMPPNAQSETGEQAPGLVQALEQQTGLKMEAKKTPVTVYVIDHVAKPSAN